MAAKDRGPAGAGRAGSVHRAAFVSLLVMTAAALAVLGVHLGAWVNAGVVSVEDGGYAQFELTPIVIGSGIGFAVAGASTVLARVLPRRIAVSAVLVGGAALAIAIALAVGFTVSSARSHPIAGLRATVERLHLPSSLHAEPIASTIANNDAPAVQTAWHGGAGSVDCTGIGDAVARAFPGAAVSGESGLYCDLVVMWRGTTILLFPDGLDPSGPVSVQLLAYLTY